MIFEEIRKECPVRHENGNCIPHGGFCTSVRDDFCVVIRNAYETGKTDGVLQVRDMLLQHEEQGGFINPFRRRRND